MGIRRIPAQYLNYAQQILGKYQGYMNNQPVVLEVGLDRDKLFVTANVDLLGSDGRELEIIPSGRDFQSFSARIIKKEIWNRVCHRRGGHGHHHRICRRVANHEYISGSFVKQN